jgi:glutamine amidotransferase-like uncharacterized protein
MSPRLLAFILLSVSPVVAKANEPLLIPAVVGDWTLLAKSPDMKELSSGEQRCVEASLWQASDGSWQLMGCISGTKEQGHHRVFHQWQAMGLTETFAPKGVALRADIGLGEAPGGLRGPTVIRDGELYRMFYSDHARICMAESTDGKSFTRSTLVNGQPAAFAEPATAIARDPWLLRHGDEWLAYYAQDPKGAEGIYCRKSTDLKTWTSAQVVASVPPVKGFANTAGNPCVVEPTPGNYYLFRTVSAGRSASTYVYQSHDPMDFGKPNENGDALHLVTKLPLAGLEVIHHAGQWYVLALRSDFQGYQIAKLEWRPLASPKPAPPNDKLRIALYDDSGSAGKGVPSCSKQLSLCSDMEVVKFNASDIRAGLDGYHVVIFSGGSGGKQANTIGLLGREQVRRFVEAGGGYIGICAGAYLACSGFKWSVPILDAKTPSSYWERGHGDLQLETNPLGQKLMGLPAQSIVIYHNGPLLTPAKNPAIADFEALAYFRTEVSKTPKHAGLQINTPAMVQGSYGKGKVLVSSPHPEQTKGMETWLERAVRTVAPAP